MATNMFPVVGLGGSWDGCRSRDTASGSALSICGCFFVD